MTNLYILKKIGSEYEINYNDLIGLVIEAVDEEQARNMAKSYALGWQANAPDIWLDVKQTTCKVLSVTGEPTIIMSNGNIENRGKGLS